MSEVEPLKITIFGLTISSSWGNGHATPYRAILRALHRRGHKLVFYEKDVEYYRKRRDFACCDFCQLVLYPEWEQVRARALQDALESDVVMTASYCPEGARISDELLALSGPLRVFYDLDTPITLSKLEGGDLEYLRGDQIGAFDLYLSFTGGAIVRELEQRWNAQRARALYGCVDPDVYHRVPARNDFRCGLSYMGTYATDRQQKVDDLFLEPARRSPRQTFVLAGSMYPWQWTWPQNVRRFEHVAPGEHPALYSSSRMTLNLTRAGMARTGYCPSGRFFEAAACGTPILTDWFEGIDTFFSPGEEIFLVKNSGEVTSALAAYDGELAGLARRARQRTLEEHTGKRRAEQLISYLQEARAMAPRQRASLQPEPELPGFGDDTLWEVAS